jgi:hypothetical protein
MIDLRKLGRVLPVAVALAVAVPALSAEAAIYNVYGRVFASTPLMSGEPYPDTGLLADEVETAPETVLGSATYAALEPSGMVRVQAVDAASGDPIADARDLAVYGAYFMRFDIPASTTRVRFQILDPDGGALLHETPATDLSAGTTLRYLLTPTGTGVGAVMPASIDAALFTRVGWVEVADIANGFASFASLPAAYRNAPFGAGLRLFGGFSPDYYPSRANSSRYCYTIEVTPSGGTPFDITAPLRKRRYEVLSDGSVTSEMVALGPYAAAGESHCYTPTPISTRGGVFWSEPDLLARWNTRPRTGAHTVKLKLFDTTTNTQVMFGNDNQSIALFLNNTPVQLTFDTVEVQQTDGSTHTDLLRNRCDIAQLMDSRSLAVDYTAFHSAGFLARYGMSLRANDGSGGPSQSGAYSGGLRADGTPQRFQGRAASVGAEVLDASAFPGSCAYVVNISAVARTTNGYHRPYRGHRQLFYYIQK